MSTEKRRGFQAGCKSKNDYFKVCEHVTLVGFREVEVGSGDLNVPCTIICSQCPKPHKLSHEDHY